MRNCLFYWIPKTGGTSIFEGFKRRFPSEVGMFKTVPAFDTFDAELPFVTFCHLSVDMVVQHGCVDQSWVDQRFRFTFVRNSWARLVSLYNNIMAEPEHEFYDRLPTFESLIDPLETTAGPGPSLANTGNLVGTSSQLSWFPADNLHWIGRTDDYAKSYSELCQLLDVAPVEVPHLNKHKHKPYRDYYTPRTRAIVAKRYEEEIDRFKFVF
jgi:hypothetical protein